MTTCNMAFLLICLIYITRTQFYENPSSFSTVRMRWAWSIISTDERKRFLNTNNRIHARVSYTCQLKGVYRTTSIPVKMVHIQCPRKVYVIKKCFHRQVVNNERTMNMCKLFRSFLFSIIYVYIYLSCL